jgi:hypothetical protein
MRKLKPLAKSGFVLALMVFASACVVAPREGYYDRDHHRYYREHNWHECGERDEHCH